MRRSTRRSPTSEPGKRSAGLCRRSRPSLSRSRTIGRGSTPVWLYVERALTRLESGEDVTAEAALAKRLATETALAAIDHAIQFHGGRGYSSGLPHERRYRDVRSGGIAHGPDEVLLRAAAGWLWPRTGRPRAP